MDTSSHSRHTYGNFLRCCFLLAILTVAAAPQARATGLIIDLSDGDITSNPPGDDGGPGVFYNGAAGFAQLSISPLWWQTNGSAFGYNASIERFGALASGAGQTSVWTFTGLTPGIYSVHTFYFPGGNRTTAAPFEIFDGTVETGTLIASPIVDQEIAPDDFTIDDGQGEHTWELLSDGVVVTSGTLAVRLTSVENFGNMDFVIADAIRVEALSDLGLPAFAITDISYAPELSTVRLTWRSRAGTTYIAKYSDDMVDWGGDMGDGIGMQHDEILDDGDLITVTFNLIQSGIDGESELFFRIEEEPK